MGHEEHRGDGPGSVGVYVITASDTRDESTDGSGALIQERMKEAGHRIEGYRILKDEPALIRQIVEGLLGVDRIDVIMVNGGTGIAPRDSTFEALQSLMEKEIPGFGELFRSLSYTEIGSAAMLSRACAGVAQGIVILSVPGSTAAVRLALDKLILPELSHMVGLLKGKKNPDHTRDHRQAKGHAR